MTFRKNTAEDFWVRLDRSGGPEVCWPWKGKRQFQLSFNIRPFTAWAWILTHGSLPTNKKVLHKLECPNVDNRCGNPAHLMLGTAADQVRRVHDHPLRHGKKGAKWKIHATRCPQGHLYETSAVIRKDGYRRCKICCRIGVQRRRSRQIAMVVNPLVAKLLATA